MPKKRLTSGVSLSYHAPSAFPDGEADIKLRVAPGKK